MKVRFTAIAFLLGICLLPLAADAQTISINFSGGRSTEPNGFTLAPGDLAGNPAVAGSFVSNWNNAGGASGTNQSLVDNTGAATSVLLSYSGPNGWSLGDTSIGTNLSGGANPQMMRGYLDSSDTVGASATLTGLASLGQPYRLAIFFDGDNGGNWREATYTITDVGTATMLFQGKGEDSENVNFNTGSGNNANGLFQVPLAGGTGNVDWPNSPNNSEGNFILTDFLTADSINILSSGTAGAGTTRRAPINGLQVVVPEPASLSLLAVGLAGLLFWRRRQ